MSSWDVIVERCCEFQCTTPSAKLVGFQLVGVKLLVVQNMRLLLVDES